MTAQAGVPRAWFGSLPRGWNPRPLWTVLDRNDGGVWGEDGDEEDTIVLRSTELRLDGSWTLEDPAYRRLTATERTKALLADGDLVVTKSSGSPEHLGKTGLVTREVAALEPAFSNFMQRLRVRRDVCPRYIFWLLNSAFGRETLNYFGSTTTGLRNLTGGVLGRILFPGPQPAEQRAIADFLDRKASAIDALIDNKERLVSLLTERRDCLVAHVVTTGLQPGVQMKSAGVSWADTIPVAWTVARMKHGYGFSKGRNAQELTAQFIGEHPGPYAVYSGQTENEGVMGTTDSFAYELPEALLVTTVGSSKVMTPRLIGGRFSLSQNCAMVTPKRSDVCLKYLFYLLPVIFRHERASIPEHLQASLRLDDLRRFDALYPPYAEQVEIAEHVEKIAVANNVVIDNISRSTEKLREYRQALITAAVTGQLDIVAQEAA